MLANRSWDDIYKEIEEHLDEPEKAMELISAHANNVRDALSIGARARTLFQGRDSRSPLAEAVIRVDDQLVHYYQRIVYCQAHERNAAAIVHILRERRVFVRNAVTALQAVIGNTNASQPEVLGFARFMKDLAGTN